MENYINNITDITYPDRLFQSGRDPESIEYHVGISPNLPPHQLAKLLTCKLLIGVGVKFADALTGYDLRRFYSVSRLLI